jgi:hypothetical protein
MDKVVSFLRGRFKERSSQVQLVVLVLLGAVSAGYLTVDQVNGFATQAMTLLAVVGPLAGVLIPDPSKPQDAVDAAQAAATAVQAAALQAVEAKVGVEAKQAVEADVARVVDEVASLAGRVGVSL